MTRDPCAPWRNSRVMLTLALVFFCGVLTGGLTMRFAIHEWMHTPEPFWQEGGKEITLLRLTKELDLSPEQAQRMEMVLDDFVKYVQMLQAQMDDVRAIGKDRILLILNAEQKVKFEKMLGELQVRQRDRVP